MLPLVWLVKQGVGHAGGRTPRLDSQYPHAERMGPDLHVLDPCHGWYLENAPPPALKHKPPEGGFFYFDGFTGHASALRQRHGHRPLARRLQDRKSTRLNSSHLVI